MTSALIIPTFNEIDGVKSVMPRVDRQLFDSVLVVDGGSNDGTVDWLKQNDWPVLVQTKKGLGNAYREALAVTQSDVVVTFSPDGNSVPERLPALLSEINKGYDMVIVSRYIENARSEDDDFLTAFGNPLFTFLINQFFGGEYTDSLVIYRAYKREILERLKIDAVHLTYEAQLSIRAAKHKLKISEIPGDEPKRIGGVRKMNPLTTGFGILMEIIRNIR